MLNVSHDSYSSDELSRQHGQPDQELLARGVWQAQAECMVCALSRVRHRKAAPTQQPMEGAECSAGHVHLLELSHWQWGVNARQEHQDRPTPGVWQPLCNGTTRRDMMGVEPSQNVDVLSACCRIVQTPI